MPITKSNRNADLANITLLKTDIPAAAKVAGLGKLHKELLRKTVDKMKKFDSKKIDEAVLNLHEQAFEIYDCFDCGNCCRSISPAINNLDIDLMAKKLRVKASEVVVKYLRMDEDGDFVYRNQPCPFIEDDNHCSVYTHRPKACREYPHTDRKKFHQLLDLSLMNASICPVVYTIIRKIGAELIVPKV